MADNTQLNVGSSGDIIATDDIGGVKHQRVKVQYGGDGSATDVSATAPLPIEISDGTDTALVTAAGALTVDGSAVTQPVSPDNTISTNNSTTSTLGISGVYTGTGEDISDYSAVTIQLDSSHNSATDGMTFQFSTDNTNWDDVYSFTYTAANGARRFQFPATAQYFRLVYTNGAVGQTHFRVQTILHRTAVGSSIHRLGDDTSADRSAQVVKAAIVAQAGGAGDFVAVQTTAGGNFKVALEEYENVPTGAGTAAGALRVELPTDGTGVVGAAQSGTWNITNVSGTVSLPTGAATSANQLPDGHNVTVDNTTAAPANVQVGDGTNQASVTAGGDLQVTLASETVNVASASALDVSGAVVTVDLAGNNDVTIDGSTVVGTDAAAHGASQTGIRVMGTDGTNDQQIAVDPTGNVQVDIVADAAGLATSANQSTANTSLGNIDTATASVADAVGTDGTAGPTSVMSVGGTETGGNVQELRVDADGHIQNDVLSIAAGTNLIGDVGLGVRTSGGTTLFKDIDVDETAAGSQVKASAGQVYWVHAMNLGAATLFLKFYDQTSVTVGTTVPDLTFPVPTQGDTNGAGFTLSIPNGIAFATGIIIAATTGVLDNDSGAPGANACVVNLGYA